MLSRADYHTIEGRHIDHIRIDGGIIPLKSRQTHAVLGEDIVYWMERVNACRSLRDLALSTSTFNRFVFGVGSGLMRWNPSTAYQWNQLAMNFWTYVIDGLVFFDDVNWNGWWYDKNWDRFWNIPDISIRLVKNRLPMPEGYRPKILVGAESTLRFAYGEMKDKMYLVARDGWCSQVISRGFSDARNVDYTPMLSEWKVKEKHDWDDQPDVPDPQIRETYGYSIEGYNQEQEQHYYVVDYLAESQNKIVISIPAELVPLIDCAYAVCKEQCTWEFGGMCNDQRGSSFYTSMVGPFNFNAEGVAEIFMRGMNAQPPQDIGLAPSAPQPTGRLIDHYVGYISCNSTIETLIFRISKKFDY